jgi:hypothetical protein
MGLATAGGIFLWQLPGGPVIFTTIWLVARALLRHTARGVMVGLALGTPVSLLIWRPPPPVTAYTLAVIVVLLIRHISDFHREYQVR